MDRSTVVAEGLIPSKWNNTSRLKFFKEISSFSAKAQDQSLDTLTFGVFKKLDYKKRVIALALILNTLRPDLTREDLAAIIGNSVVESNLNPDIINPKSGAFGLFQWLWYSRVENFVRYILSKPGSAITGFVNPVYQCEFILNEDKLGVPWVDQVCKADGVDAKSDAFMKYAEGVSGTTSAYTSRRRLESNKVLAILKKFK